MKQEQFEAITKWQKETFGQATALSKVEHLKQEIEELKSDVFHERPSKREEFADCFILLFGAASSDGMSYEDICNAIAEKMEINYNRKWLKPDENGVVNHVKEENTEIIPEVVFELSDKKILKYCEKSNKDTAQLMKRMSKKDIEEHISRLIELGNDAQSFAFEKDKKLWLELKVVDSYSSSNLLTWMYGRSEFDNLSGLQAFGCQLQTMHFSMPSGYSDAEKMAISTIHQKMFGGI